MVPSDQGDSVWVSDLKHTQV